MATKQQLQQYFIDQTILLAAEEYPNTAEVRAAYMAGILASHLAEAAYNDSKVIDRFRQYIREQGLTKPLSNYKPIVK